MTTPHTLTFDAAPSARSTDENGFLHVSSSHITKATANPYYGREIPGWQEAGLDPEAVYYGFRAPEELQKSLSTWQGLPLHIEHHIDSAEEPARLTRVGAVGAAVWNAPYIDAPLTVWNADAIEAIKDGSFRELSCAYRYDPDFTPGQYEGVAYDFVMRNIRGNHVALVEEGRAGPDVVVADANTVNRKHTLADAIERLFALIGGGRPDMAQDDRWITVHPNGPQNTGRPALIDENGTVKAGMGGKFNGRNIDDIPRGQNPHPVPEEKYQARQQRQAQQAGAENTVSSPASHPPLDASLVQRANGMSALGQAGEYTRREYRQYVDRINQLNLPEAEKKQAIADIHQKLTERLEAEASAASPMASGRARLNAGAIRKSADKASQKSAEAQAIFEKAQSTANKANVAATKQTREAALAQAYKNGDLEAFVGNERWYRANRRSGTWRQDINYQAPAHDAAFEEDKHPRDKSGRFGKGSGKSGDERGASSGAEISLTGKELGSYRDVKELRQKAVDYYKEHLQGKPAHRDDIGEIRFSRKGRGETFSFSVNPDKLLIIPALRDIIEKGKLGREEALNHPRKDGIVAFIPVTKTVNLKGRPQEVEVLLGKDRKGNLYYDMFLEQRKNPQTVAGSHNPRLSGDSTGFQSAVDLNIAIKPVRVNPQTGAGKTFNSHLKGAFMGKLKHWFRGAQDADPETERKEVDLAQAIIDLHKVDPTTGEIVDVTEDEDKAAEIRKLVGEFSGKLDPEEIKRLTDALTDLAYSPATGDTNPDNGDDRFRKAMDACGLDADDEHDTHAFAAGVKYGEELERNPEERRRLDREHESEGMKKAMDACGLDAENPAESRAFAEGVKYGEELIRNPEERRKLDREHEAEGMKKAMGKDEDKNAAITRILDEVPDLTPEQRKKLFDSLQDLAYSPATGDAEPDDPSAAQDSAFRRRSPRPLTAMDAARIKASAIAEAQNHMRGLHQAVRDVRGLVGDLDPLAFDSASDVYGYALEQAGVDPRKYPRQAWRGMVDVLCAQKRTQGFGMARDHKSVDADFSGAFAGLKNINVAD